jgi:acyl-CoA thioesterase-1
VNGHLLLSTSSGGERIFPSKKKRAGKRRLESRVAGWSGGSILVLLLSILLVGPVGCRRGAESTSAAPVAVAEAEQPSLVAAAAPVADAAAAPQVVFLGDSLTAGLGLGEEAAYPAIVGELLAERGVAVRIVNAGVSGDTSAGGLARVDWLLSLHPDVLVVALGGNDGLRGQPVATIESNLREIVRRARGAGARVVIAGMKMPPNYGPEYTREFEALYARLARELELPFIPFLLEGVAADPRLNQPDGIHPTAEGQRKVAALVVQTLLPLLQSSPG